MQNGPFPHTQLHRNLAIFRPDAPLPIRNRVGREAKASCAWSVVTPHSSARRSMLRHSKRLSVMACCSRAVSSLGGDHCAAVTLGGRASDSHRVRGIQIDKVRRHSRSADKGIGGVDYIP